jgi:histidinol-phosphate/aromatic aminotransferase/cobyric acid decarboxylase-like protein
LVRHFDKPGLQDKLRITIGTAEENDQLLAALSAP